MNVNDALAKLDPNNDEHWTSEGMPRLDVVGTHVGKSVTRDQLTKVAPEFSREAARAKASADQKAQGEQTEQAPPLPDESQGETAAKAAVAVQVPVGSAAEVAALDARHERAEPTALVTVPGEEVNYPLPLTANDPASPETTLDADIPDLPNDAPAVDGDRYIGSLTADDTNVNGSDSEAAATLRTKIGDLSLAKARIQSEIVKAQNDLAVIETRVGNPAQQAVPMQKYMQAQQQEREQRAGIQRDLSESGIDMDALKRATSGAPVDEARRNMPRQRPTG